METGIINRRYKTAVEPSERSRRGEYLLDKGEELSAECYGYQRGMRRRSRGASVKRSRSRRSRSGRSMSRRRRRG